MLQKAFENILRNWLTTIPVVLVMAALLTLGSGLFGAYTEAQKTLKNIEQKFSITIYLKDDADPFEVGKLITSLEERSDVIKPIVYTSKEAAWKLVSKTFGLDASLLKKYQFSLPASLTITPVKPEQTDFIEAFLELEAKNLLKDPLFAKDQQRNLTHQMIAFIAQVKDGSVKTLLFFVFLFVVGGALLVSSTIHLAITNRHREISIMKLVGASQKNILTPFVLEGILLSLAAYIIHLLFLVVIPLPGTLWGSRPQLNFLLAEFIVVVVLATVVSHITALLHLRKKSLFS